MNAKNARCRSLNGNDNQRSFGHLPGSEVEPAVACRIHIVGSQLLLNGLMAITIDRAFGIGCRCCGFEAFTPDAMTCEGEGPTLILLDGHSGTLGAAHFKLMGQLKDRRIGATICLYNVPASHSGSLEGEAFQAGVRGVFYKEDPPEVLFKGIEVLLSGECWYSRETQTRCRILRPKPSRRPNGGSGALGFRERQILRLIAAGHTNDEIAQQLNLSIHTIKTHAYNLYRKIDAPNRVQATLWAAKHMVG